MESNSISLESGEERILCAGQNFPTIELIEDNCILVLRLLPSESGRLLDTLTRALQSSGVDLSKANISVQIDLGQNATVAAADTSVKVNKQS